ncbi:TetR/AcrR family transcriptional regulator [Rhodococcus spelaei]|uniref:TetR/AcrR family transcriptional regulator n=1 Tax=Rhodococcus spelaei TaxID=2546320 RepID=A0A541BR33_9NOCA|nr:TetR/AcrR family transcriptional regulator [Rhodococcus spelaei]TQF74777.1 TetR/AcrR family transcriptional regulator [Rhodococcus spelaei]
MSEFERVDKRSLRYAGRRAELLAAITDYVVEHGVLELSMRPLAREVGVSHASLLHHFGSKENLLAEVIENMRVESIPLDLLADPGGDPLGLLTEWWSTRMDPAALPRFRVMLEIYVQAVLHPEANERFLARFVGQWLTALEKGLRSAGCPDDEAPLEATLILGQVRGLSLDLLATGDRARVDGAFALFVDGIAAKIERWRPAAT